MMEYLNSLFSKSKKTQNDYTPIPKAPITALNPTYKPQTQPSKEDFDTRWARAKPIKETQEDFNTRWNRAKPIKETLSKEDFDTRWARAKPYKPPKEEKPFLGEVWDGLKQFAQMPSNALQETLSQSPSKTLDQVEGGVSNSINTMYQLLSKGAVTPAVNSITGSRDNFMNKYVNPYIDKQKQELNKHQGSSDIYQLSSMATDPRNALFGGGSITEKPIANILAKALQGAGAGGAITASSEAMANQPLNGREIAKSATLTSLLGALTGLHKDTPQNQYMANTNIRPEEMPPDVADIKSKPMFTDNTQMTPEEISISNNLSDTLNKSAEYSNKPQGKSVSEIMSLIRKYDKGGEAQANLYKAQMEDWAKAENIKRAEQGLEPVTADDMSRSHSVKYFKHSDPYKMSQSERSIPATSRSAYDETIPHAKDKSQMDGNELYQSKVLEDKYLKNDRVLENALTKEADVLPEPIGNQKDFNSQLTQIDGRYGVHTPVGDVFIDSNRAFNHLRDNTHFDDREYMSGAFASTLKDPLFVVSQKYKGGENLVFYKPFKDKVGDGKYHLASFTLNKNGLTHKTFYEIDNLGKVKGLIKSAEKDLKYYKHSSINQASSPIVATEHGITTASHEHDITTASQSAYDETIPQAKDKSQVDNDDLLQANQDTDVKGAYNIDKNLIKIFKSHDLSTLNHELGHRFLFTLDAKERAVAEQVFGVKDGKWSVENHEAFADAYTRYIAEGKVQTSGLKAIFDKFREFTKNILLALKDNNRGKLPSMSKDKRAFFKAVLGDEKAKVELMGKYKAKDAINNIDKGELYQKKIMEIPENLLAKEEKSTIGKDVEDFKANVKKVKGIVGILKENMQDLTPEYYKDIANDRFTGLRKVEDKATLVNKALVKLSPKTNEILHSVIVGDLEELPDGYKMLEPLVDSIRKEVKTMTNQLVDLGMLDKETAESFGDRYLKRSYARHWAKGGGVKPENDTGIEQITQRGKDLKTDDAEEVLNFVNEFLRKRGKKEIKNPMGLEDIKDELESRGLLDNTIANNKLIWREERGKVVLRRDWTKAERESMGEITNASVSVPTTMLKMASMIENAKMMRELKPFSENFKNIDEARENGYELIPDSPRYGELAGLYVEKHIASNIKYAFEKMGEFKEFIKEGLSFWKQGKTVFNPSAHINNIMGNFFTQFMMGRNIGESMKMIKRTLENVKLYPTKIAKYEELRARNFMGLLGSSEKAEFAKLQKDLKYYIEGHEVGIFGRGKIHDVMKGYDAITNQFAMGGKVGNALDKIRELYSTEDDFPRLASYSTLREGGMSAKEAKEFVTSLFPDYTKPLPPLFKNLRDSGISPFISWSYYVLPNMWKLIKGHPTRYVGFLTTVYVAAQLASGISPFGDKIPDDAKGRRIPISKDGTTFKIDRMLPGFDFTSVPLDAASQLITNIAKGKTAEGFNNAVNALGSDASNLATNYIGGPAATVYDMLRNKDNYTGRSITGNTQRGDKETYNYLSYILKQIAPAPLANVGGLIENAINPKLKRRHSEVVPRTNTQELLKLLTGVNLLTYNTKEVEKKRKKASQKFYKEF